MTTRRAARPILLMSLALAALVTSGPSAIAPGQPEIPVSHGALGPWIESLAHARPGNTPAAIGTGVLLVHSGRSVAYFADPTRRLFENGVTAATLNTSHDNEFVLVLP